MIYLAFLFINALIFFSWFLFFSTVRKGSLTCSLVYTGAMSGIQIVVAQLGLGIIGLLYLSYLILFHLFWSFALLGWVSFYRRTLTLPILKEVSGKTRAWFKIAITWENVLLLSLLLLVGLWILVAAIFLPPRGIDDLVYHLPSLYQFVQTHQIELLPLELRKGFAFPLNGDFLFLWPLIFFHEDFLIDFVGFVIGFFGVIVLYGLARRLKLPPRMAFFIGLLFLFLPVVLGQAGSNYVDVILAVCFFSLLYSVVSFFRTGETLHLVLAALITGVGVGIKYNMFIFILALQPILWLRFWKDKSLLLAAQRYFIYGLLSIPISLYWFVRNYLETGHPLFPFKFYSISQSGAMSNPVSGLVGGLKPQLKLSRALGSFLEDPMGFLYYPFYDLGLGSFHGGFGVIFWGLGIPAAIYYLYRGVKSALKMDFSPILFWGLIPVGFYAVFLTPFKDFQFNQRYILFVVGFGLLAFGMVLQKFERELPFSGPILKIFCIGASILSVIHLGSYMLPSYQIKEPVKDWVNKQQTSQYKYYTQSPWDLPSLSIAWEPLDYLTRDTDGWSVYMAANYGVFWVTPNYGSQIQNRIWNFEENPSEDPDAIIFHYDSRKPELFYLGKKITPEEIQKDPRYELVTQLPYTQLWVKQEILKQPEVSKRLADFYRILIPDAINTAEKIKQHVTGESILVTSSPLGYGFKYLSLIGEIDASVYLVPKDTEQDFTDRIGSEIVYTVDLILKGYDARPLIRLNSAKGVIFFYENKKISGS